MKLTITQRRLIVAGIGVTFIILGIIQGVFKIKFSKTIITNINLALMIIALWAFIGGRKTTGGSEPKSDQSAIQPETGENLEREKK